MFTVPDYFELHEVCKVLHATGTTIRLDVMLSPIVKDIDDEKHRVLVALLNDKHFAQARKFAEMVGLADDHITLKEVRKSLNFSGYFSFLKNQIVGAHVNFLMILRSKQSWKVPKIPCCGKSNKDD